GGVLGLLLGNKKLRKMGGGVVAYGGAAALGALAPKTYQDWQQKSAEQAAVSNPAQIAPPPTRALAMIPVSQLAEHSRTILAAMLAAVKADGHIGAEELQLLDAEIAKVTNQADDRAWFDAQMAKPADPMETAAPAKTPEQAAEVYLACLLVIDEQSYME